MIVVVRIYSKMTAMDKRAGVSILLVLPFASPEPGKGGFRQWTGYSAQCVRRQERALEHSDKASTSWWACGQPPRAEE